MIIGIYIDAEDLALGLEEVLKNNNFDPVMISTAKDILLDKYDLLIVSDDRTDNLIYDNRKLIITYSSEICSINYLSRPFTATQFIKKIEELIAI